MMATPATQERISSNPAITTAPEVQVGESQPQPQEIPDLFQEGLDTPQVSERFWIKVGRWAQTYGEFKLTTGYWSQFRI